MDDPWGSPWATSDNSASRGHELFPPLPTLPADTTATLELPARTLKKLPSFSSQSPWATDDDRFGDWESAEPGARDLTGASAGGSGWPAWHGETGSNSSQHHTPLPGASLDQPSPIAWPAATSPGLNIPKTLSRRSSARSLFRQPSPDPWATELSHNLDNVKKSDLSTSTQQHLEAAKTAQKEPDGTNIESGGMDMTDVAKDTSAPSSQDLDKAPESHEKPTNSGLNAIPHSESPAISRRSSSSGESQHDEERQDSPITSMDEDSKDLPPASRKASSVKVQELVTMYDCLAKKEVERRPSAVSLTVPKRHRSASRSSSIKKTSAEDDGEDGDFGDFEEAVTVEPFVKSSPARPTTSKIEARARSIPRPSRRGTTGSLRPTTAHAALDAPSKLQILRSRFGPVKFEVNLEAVNKLFDNSKLDAAQPASKDYSLDAVDGIIKDTFATISERKAWYRISRPGSMRRHNMGDDDNYRRVQWPTSTVHEETTKIVRRWMEEDSYSGGHASFGGPSSAKGTGMFNWDSKAEPVSLDQVFGKRRSAQAKRAAATPISRPLSLQGQPRVAIPLHSRNTSVASTGAKSLPPSSPFSIPAPPSATGLTFGWATATNGTSTTSSSRPTSQPIRQSMDVKPMEQAKTKEIPPSRLKSEVQSPVLSSTPTALAAAPMADAQTATLTAEDDDDDDEWGEMVASPPSNSRPASGFFDSDFNVFETGEGENRSISVAQPVQPVPVQDTSATLDAVSSRLKESEAAAAQKATPSAPTASNDLWDFSFFDTTPAAPPSVPGASRLPPAGLGKLSNGFNMPVRQNSMPLPPPKGNGSQPLPFTKTHKPSQSLGSFSLPPPRQSAPTRMASPLSFVQTMTPHPQNRSPKSPVRIEPVRQSPTSLHKPALSLEHLSTPLSPQGGPIRTPSPLSLVQTIKHESQHEMAPSPVNTSPTHQLPAASIPPRRSSVSFGQSPQNGLAHAVPTPSLAQPASPSPSPLPEQDGGWPLSPVTSSDAQSPVAAPPTQPHKPSSSLSLGRLSTPLTPQNVVSPGTPAPSLPRSPPPPAGPGALPPAKTASFAVDDEETRVVRRIVGGLPDLSYMLR